MPLPEGRLMAMSTCPTTGKIQLPGPIAAAGYAARMTARHGGTMRTYRCEHCSCWHVTTQPRREVS